MEGAAIAAIRPCSRSRPTVRDPSRQVASWRAIERFAMRRDPDRAVQGALRRGERDPVHGAARRVPGAACALQRHHGHPGRLTHRRARRPRPGEGGRLLRQHASHTHGSFRRADVCRGPRTGARRRARRVGASHPAVRAAPRCAPAGARPAVTRRCSRRCSSCRMRRGSTRGCRA